MMYEQIRIFKNFIQEELDFQERVLESHKQ